MNPFSPTALAGQRILVTGASSGIGRATALVLAQSGAQLTITGRNQERLDACLAELYGEGHRSVARSLDDADGVADWLKALAVAEGPFNGLFHSSGISLVKPARLTKQADINGLLGSSLMAGFGIARAAAQKGVLNDEASLVFMSSAAGRRGQPGMTAYSAAKAAIEGLVRSFACEMAPRRIRVNAIAAGAVETEMHSNLEAQMGNEAIEHYATRHLLGFGKAEDVAHAAAFLLTPAARWITGTTMVVDGGYTVR